MVGGEAGGVLGAGGRQRLRAALGGGRVQSVVDIRGGVQPYPGVPVVVVVEGRC